MVSRKRPIIAMWVVAVSLAVFTAAACGSSASGQSVSGDSSSSQGLAMAKKVVDQYRTRPSRLLVTAPVGKPIPAGKTIAFIHCGVPACNIWRDAFQQAASVLGWTVKTYYTNGTVAGVATAFDQVLQDKPDAVVSTGFPSTDFASQIAQLKAMNIPVMNSYVAQTAGDGQPLVLVSGEGPVGQIYAAEATVLQDGKANVLFANATGGGFDVLKPVLSTFKTDFPQYCPGCQVAYQNVPQGTIGSQSTTTIVSYLESHPDVNTLINTSAAITESGLPAALRAAGITKVKILDDAPNQVDYAYIRSGLETAAIQEPIDTTAWSLIDGLARIFTGGSPSADQQPPQYWLIDKNNLPSSDGFAKNVADYVSEFKKIWGKN
jgi:ABC-type sugar transport system substrate-binding protein